jgi:hypothetical protein
VHLISLLAQAVDFLFIFLTEEVEIHLLQFLLLFFADSFEEPALALQLLDDGLVGLDGLGVLAGGGF